MFTKAEKLVLGANSSCPSPDSVNAKLVESKSGSCPHFVTVKAKHKYLCDSDCAMFKCAKICSHIIVCAYIDDKLQPFISQAIASPSYYELAKADTVPNAGKKPCNWKASSKSTVKAIRELKSINVSTTGVSTLSVTPPPICSLNAVNTEFVRTVSTTALKVMAVSLQQCKSLSVTLTSAHPVMYCSSQGSIHATITSCGSSVQLSNLVQSPITSITQDVPQLPMAAASFMPSGH